MTQDVIAIDIGATNTRVARVSAEGVICDKNMKRTINQDGDGQVLIDQVVEQIEQCVSAVSDIKGFGVSVAGVLFEDGSGYRPTNLFFEDVPIARYLHDRYDLPVYLLNDTKAAVTAEWMVGRGEQGSVKNMCYFTISSGIGCGAVVDGHVLFGRTGNAGEVGMMSVDVSFVDGEHWWEYYVSGNNLVRFYASWCAAKSLPASDFKTAKEVYDAEYENTHMQEFFDEVGRVNAQGVFNAILLYNPELVVFGGSVAEHNWESFRGGIEKHIRRDYIKPLPHFAKTELGDEISLIGAGMYAHDMMKKS